MFFFKRKSEQEKEIKEALKASEQLFCTLIENANDLFWTVDEKLTYTYISPKIRKILGYGPEEVIGRSLVDLMSADEAQRIRTICEPVISQQLPFNNLENTRRHRNGKMVTLVSSGVPVFGSDGAFRGYHGIDRNISERKQAEKTLSEQSNILDSFFIHTTTPFTILDRDFNYIRVNEAYARAGQRDVSDFPGRNYFELYPSDAKAIFEWVIAKKEPYNAIAAPFVNPDHPELGETYWDWKLIPIMGDTGEVEFLVLSIQDVTERKTAEQKMARLYEEIKNEAEVSSSLLDVVEKLNSSLDEKDLIENVMNLAPRYMKFDRIAIYLYENDIKSFTYTGGCGFSIVEEGQLVSKTFKMEDFPAIDRLLKGEAVMIENAAGTELISRNLAEIFRAGSVVIVPIMFKEKLIGGIAGQYIQVKMIDSKDISLLKGLADGMAIALQNSRLYRESIERLMELSTKMETIKIMAQLDREILANVDRNVILANAAALMNRLIPCERTAIILIEDDACRVVSEWGIGRFRDRIYGRKDLHIEIMEARKSPIFVPDILKDSDKCDYHRDLAAIGIRSSVLIPLINNGQITGILDIGSEHYGRLTPEHINTAGNIASQIAVALDKARLYEELRQLYIATITSLVSTIDLKSSWTKGHSERATSYAMEIGKGMGLYDEELERLKLAGLLHDIGMIETIDVLLDKTGKLTGEEFELMKKHPKQGADILTPIKQLKDIIPGIKHHHERYDGSGYPDGLRGEEIPLMARILAVADSFDAMTAERPYRPSPGKEYAVSEFKRCSGTQFDPGIVEVFLKVLDV